MRAKEKLGKTVSIRSEPRVTANNATGNVILPYTIVDYVAIADDLDHPGNAAYRWLQLADSRYANYIYPPNGIRFDLLPDAPPSPPPAPPAIHHIEVVFTDGTRDKFVPE